MTSSCCTRTSPCFAQRKELLRWHVGCEVDLIVCVSLPSGWLCCLRRHSFSRDGEYLATGDNDGQVKIWRISTGQCVRRFPKAHIQGITSITFSRDGTQIVTTSFDGTAKLHGLKSGKQLKVFSGHTSFVNCAVITADNGRILTGSSDGTARVRLSLCL